MSDAEITGYDVYMMKKAFDRNRVSDVERVIAWMTSGDNLFELREVALGNAKIVFTRHVIDCDANPFVPEGWSVEKHQKGDDIVWDPAKVGLYYSEAQEKGKRIYGEELRAELANQPVLNANVLDRLVAYPHLIPEEWKGNTIFFWGTILRSHDNLLVPFLVYEGGRWCWDAGWLVSYWDHLCPAAVLKS